MRMGRGWSLSLALLLVGLGSADARADVIDPAEEVCANAGDACELDGQSGACQAQTCSRLDYGNPGPDGTPGTASYECVRCVPGAAPPPDDSKDAVVSPDAKGSDALGPETPKGGPEPHATTKGTRCAVGPTTTSMLSFALGLGLLGLVARRRR